MPNINVEKITLDDAIRQIKRTCDLYLEAHLKFPYFFIIGAGVSQPHIPLSSKIVADCKEENDSKNLGIKDLNTKDRIKEYSYWLQQLYPTPELRRQYFEKITAGKALSPAHLRLAHLLSKKKVANFVVTPNFDDQLSRALWLFEKEHITYDHPHTIERIDLNREIIHVIHVHGNYLYYDIKNLTGEIEGNADNSLMIDKLTAIMSQYSPLVIGYSGWENDVIMAAMRRVIGSTTKNNLYWFCYEEEEIDTLPEFLKNASNVKFVIPYKPEILKEQLRPTLPLELQDSLIPPRGPIRDTSKSPNLTAIQVFDAFNQAFGCGKPDLTEKPFDFFINKLMLVDPSLNQSSESGAILDVDFYSIRMVIRRMSQAQKYLEERTKQSEINLTHVVDAVRQSNYVDALKISGDLDISLLDDKDQMEDFINAMKNALENIQIPLNEKLPLIETLIQKINQIDITSPGIDQLLCDALWKKGVVLFDMQRYDDAIVTYDQIIDRYGTTESTELQILVASALFNKGFAQDKMGQHKTALSAFDQIIEKYGTSEILKLQIQVAWALYSKSWIIGDLGKRKDSIVLYDKIIEKYGTSEFAEFQVPVAWALVNKGWTLDKLKQNETALSVFDQVLNKYGTSESTELQVQAAKALLGKGSIFEKLKQRDKAVVTYNQIIEKYGTSEFTELQVPVASAFFNKGWTLDKSEQYKAALAVFDQIIEKYGTSESIELQMDVAKALLGKGLIFEKLEQRDKAVATYNKIIEKYGTSEFTELQVPAAWALFNKGWTLDKSEQYKAALAVFDQIIKKYGTSESTELQVQAVKALLGKGSIFEKLKQKDKAVTTYDILIKRYSKSKFTDIQSLVSTARNSKKRAKLRKSKK